MARFLWKLKTWMRTCDEKASEWIPCLMKWYFEMALWQFYGGYCSNGFNGL